VRRSCGHRDHEYPQAITRAVPHIDTLNIVSQQTRSNSGGEIAPIREVGIELTQLKRPNKHKV
jgi:hypothetical protein